MTRAWKGRVRVDGQDIYARRHGSGRAAAQSRHGISAVEPLSQVDFRERGLRSARARRPQRREQLSEIVERSLRQVALWDEVKDRLAKSALELSGGQQQRLCIARALAVDPEVLLMDEPASNLDPRSTIRIEDLIGELRQDYTIVIVTHNMQQAARVSDDTAFFYEGRLIEFGATDRLFSMPRERQTEEYITGRFG